MPDSQNNRIRVLMVDDHAVLRAGLRMLIESRPGLVVVGEAANGKEARALAAREQPDIILLDLDLGGENGLDVLCDLRAAAERGRVILLTASRNPIEHQRAVQLGALGVVLKEQAAEILLQAIEQVHAGRVWLDPALLARMVPGMAAASEKAAAHPEATKIASLTPREREVIGLLSEGLTNKQIAQRLSLSAATVNHHLTAIYAKLDVPSRLELVVYAYRHGLARSPHERRVRS